MARKYSTHIREEKAVELAVEVKGLENYKNAWLVINNNAREYPKAIYKVSNNSHDDIFVCCSPSEEKSIMEFLEQFGEVRVINDIDKYVVFVDVECDYDDFDKDYIDEEYVFGEIS